MDSLRVSLIVIGVVILLLLYLGSRFMQGRKGKQRQIEREEPHFQVPQQAADDWEVVPVERNQSQQVPVIDAPLVKEVEAEASSQSQPIPSEPKMVEPSPVVIEVPPAESSHVEPALADQVAPQIEEPAIAHEEKSSELPAVIALHVIAKEGVFKGTDLVKAANLAGMRYGEMQIFHFQGQTKGNVTFSMANMLEPGTFDMDNLEGFSTPGVLLFMESEFQADMEKSLDSIARVAQRLTELLGGQLSDERRRPFEPAQLDAWKQHLMGCIQPQL